MGYHSAPVASWGMRLILRSAAVELRGIDTRYKANGCFPHGFSFMALVSPLLEKTVTIELPKYLLLTAFLYFCNCSLLSFNVVHGTLPDE